MTPEDIGTLTAEIVFDEARIVNRIVYTAGDTINYSRLVDIVDSVLARRVQRVEMERIQVKSQAGGRSR